MYYFIYYFPALRPPLFLDTYNIHTFTPHGPLRPSYPPASPIFYNTVFGGLSGQLRPTGLSAAENVWGTARGGPCVPYGSGRNVYLDSLTPEIHLLYTEFAANLNGVYPIVELARNRSRI
jgi:hypothetical protein